MAPALAASERASPTSAQNTPAATDKVAGSGNSRPGPEGAEPSQLLSGPKGRVEQALTELRHYLSTKADYVGRGFADEARRIHLGESDNRTIWGEASPDEAKALTEEGIPVAPLPFLNRRDD